MNGPATSEQAAGQLRLRPPDQVMRLSRMGSFFPTRLSFMRSLLRRLSDSVGEAVSREELADASEAAAVRSVDVQMARLRRKIEGDPRFPRYLQTVRGTGYILVAD